MALTLIKRMRTRILAAVALGFGALLIAAPQVVAAERVAGGDFESTVCNGSSCTSPDWTTSVSGQPPSPATVRGPLCGDPSFVSGPPDCIAGLGSGYTSQFHWASLGSETGFAGGDDRPPDLTTSIAQNVLVPASPATLSFNLHIIREPHATGTFRVTLGGQEIYSATDATTGFDNYAQVTVPVGFAAGPGSRELRFAGEAEVDPGSTGDCCVSSDTFEIDDVSLNAGDPPAGVAPTPAPSPAGNQSAKAKRCKRKKHARAAKKKKCHRKKHQKQGH